MAFELEAIIGHIDVLREACSRYQRTHVVSLRDDWAMLPVTSGLLTEMTAQERHRQNQPSGPSMRAARDLHDPFADEPRLSPALVDWAEEISHAGPVAYVGKESFGAEAREAAIVWRDGQVTLGPLHHSADSGPGKRPLGVWPINQALRMLGVSRDEAIDEFAALGLGRHRSTEDWLRDVDTGATGADPRPQEDHWTRCTS